MIKCFYQFLLLLSLTLALLSCSATQKRQTDESWCDCSSLENINKAEYKKIDYSSRYIEMRDGVNLAIDLYLPKALEADKKIPTILIQTRYVRAMAYKWPFNKLMKGRFYNTIQYFVKHGYAVMYVDARGSGASFGKRPYPYSEAEIKDGSDVVDWIVYQNWSNGKVGGWGNSYDGGSALLLLANNNPAIKAVMPRYTMFDIFSEVVYPGGIHFEWLTDIWGRLGAALDKNKIDEFMGKNIKIAVIGSKPVDADINGKMLAAAVLEHRQNGNISKLVTGIVNRDDESLNAAGISPDTMSLHKKLDAFNKSSAAVYLYTGWFDASFLLSEIHLFLNLNDPRTKLTIGPWDHGGYNNISPNAKFKHPRFDTNFESLRFFDNYLKDTNTSINNESRVHYFTMGQERWKESDTWPPESRKVNYFLSADNKITTNKNIKPGFDSYQVDYTSTTGKKTRWKSLVNLKHSRIVYKKRKKEDKKLLCYQTAPLKADLEVTGHPELVIYIDSTATDGNFFVYLEDVNKWGKVEYVTEGLLRALHRKTTNDAPYKTVTPYRSFLKKDAEKLVAGKVTKLTIPLYPTSYMFKKGHSIRIAFAGADAGHFENVPAKEPIVNYHRGGKYPSHIVLPVVD